MTSIVNVAVTAIVAALSSGTPVASQIARVRLRPLAQSSSQAVIVRPLQSRVDQVALSPGYPVSWVTAGPSTWARRSTAGANTGPCSSRAPGPRPIRAEPTGWR